MTPRGKITEGERIVARCFGTTAGNAGLVQQIDAAISAAVKPLVDTLRICRKWVHKNRPPFHSEDVAMIDAVLHPYMTATEKPQE